MTTIQRVGIPLGGLAALAVLALLGWKVATVESASAGDTVEGTVMSTGESTLMVQTAPDHDMVTVQVASDAQITKDGERVPLEKVGSGDHVTATTKERKGETVATTIVARSPY